MVAAPQVPGSASAADDGGDDGCPVEVDSIVVPGAEFQQAVCLDDLTTFTNERTDTGAATGAGTRENGSIHSSDTRLRARKVPGVQVEGWFPDSCDRYQHENNDFMPACENGLRHNGQFVIRIPNDWDGEHLVVAGTPGVRTQFASDILLSDPVLHKGWAYASQDKGNTGLNFFRAGDDETNGSATRWEPGRAIEQWSGYMKRTAVAAEGTLEQTHGQRPSLTYASGISNGGYQTRLALERYPDQFDGGIDWEGTLLTPEAPNLFTYLPPLLQAYPDYTAGDEDAYDKMVHEGRVPPDSEPVWDNHWSIYWGLVQSTYRPVFDPEYTEYVASPREVVPPDPDALYDYDERPGSVRERIERTANTGDINDKPLITLHGTLDALLPISTDSNVYAGMVRAQGQGDNFRYYVVEGAGHVDKTSDSHPEVMRPLLPCYLDAIDALDTWVTDGRAPPPSGFVPNPAEATYEEKANACELPAGIARVPGPGPVGIAAEASRRTFGIADTVVIAGVDDPYGALAAAPLAARVDGPVLLVDDDLTAQVRRELERTGALEAVVVGGREQVSERVVDELAEAGLEVRRVADGEAASDPVTTAAAVAEHVGAPDGEAVIIAGGALVGGMSAAPLAAGAGLPILFTEGDHVPDATAEALEVLGVKKTIVVGDETQVSAGTLAELPEPRRVAGSDRYELSAELARVALSRGHTLEEIYIADGGELRNGAAAGTVAAHGEAGAVPRGVLLLIDGDDPGASAPSFEFLSERAADIDRALLFGGEQVIGADAAERVRATLAGNEPPSTPPPGDGTAAGPDSSAQDARPAPEDALPDEGPALPATGGQAPALPAALLLATAVALWRRVAQTPR